MSVCAYWMFIFVCIYVGPQEYCLPRGGLRYITILTIGSILSFSNSYKQ